MDHDSAWKEVLENLFEDFLAFFFPDLHRDIDFSQPIEFLEKTFSFGALCQRHAARNSLGNLQVCGLDDEIAV